MRYAADKPEKCTDCYFWHKRKGCCEREIGYYLVEQEKEQEPTEPVFAKLLTDAKLLYGLWLDRMQLSMRNGWLDESRKVYIYFIVESIMKALACGNKFARDVKRTSPEVSKRHVLTCQKDTLIILREIILNITIIDLSIRRNR